MFLRLRRQIVGSFRVREKTAAWGQERSPSKALRYCNRVKAKVFERGGSSRQALVDRDGPAGPCQAGRSL